MLLLKSGGWDMMARSRIDLCVQRDSFQGRDNDNGELVSERWTQSRSLRDEDGIIRLLGDSVVPCFLTCELLCLPTSSSTTRANQHVFCLPSALSAVPWCQLVSGQCSR